MSAALVTGNFFQVLGVQAALGRTLTPGDDERSAGRPVIVLSHAGWHKLFAGDPTVIGRSVRVNGVPYEIVGVMPEGFRGLGIGPPDYWAPLALAGQFRDAYAGTRGRDRRRGRRAAEAGDVAGGGDGRAHRVGVGTNRSQDGSRASRIHQAETAAGHALGRCGRGAAGLLADLLRLRADPDDRLRQRRQPAARARRLAPAGDRHPAVARRVTPAHHPAAAHRKPPPGARGGGMRSCRLAAVSGGCALCGDHHDAAGDRASQTSNLGAPAADWRVLVFLVAGAIVSTVFFGLVPALQATRLELVRTMRGEVTRDARPGRARHALIAVQVGASALLLICAAIFLRGAFAAATVDPGVRTSDTVRVSIANEPRRAALLQAVTAHPSVAAVAASSPTRGVASRRNAGAAEQRPSRVPVDQHGRVVRILRRARHRCRERPRLHAGGTHRGGGRRGRVRDHRAPALAEWRRRRAGGAPPGSAIGRRRTAPPPPSRTFTVVGVVRDPWARFRVAYLDTFRGVYLPTGPESPGTSLMLRVRGDPEQARQALLERLTSVDPGLGKIITLRTIAGMQTYILQIAFWVTVVLGGLALVLTVSGLFSVLSYRRRAAGEGDRRAHGARRDHDETSWGWCCRNRSARSASVSRPAAAWPRRWRSS